MIFAPSNLSELSRWLVLRLIQLTEGQEPDEGQRNLKKNQMEQEAEKKNGRNENKRKTK